MYLNKRNTIEIKKKLLSSKYKYISFDIFDTLIIRKVKNPRDVFSYMESNLSLNNIYIKNFYIKRVLAEKISYRFFRHPNIFQIYRFLWCTKEQKKRLIDLEIKTEKILTKANPLLFDLYDFCLKNRKQIIITSDMYIPKHIMDDILHSAGYFDYKRLYISCDVKKSKNNGDIFPYILNDLKISKDELIHLGDNKKSDIDNANGIDTIYIERR